MLRYRSLDDAWDELPPPSDTGYFHIVPFAGDILAFADSDEQGETPDFRFDVDVDKWSPLPDDPLPPVFDRQAVDYDGRLLVFGTPINRSSTKLVAIFDPDTSEWAPLPESGTQGFQVWRGDDRLYLNPHFGSNAAGRRIRSCHRRLDFAPTRSRGRHLEQ